MKKSFICLLVAFTCFFLFSCNNSQEKGDSITLPEISGMTEVEAIVATNGDFTLNMLEKSTNQYLPGVVIGYGAGLRAGDTVDSGSRVDAYIAKKPENSFSYSDQIEYVSYINMITGPNSINKDLCNKHGIGGTDLGIPVTLSNGKTLLLYGDTYSGQNMSGFWNSNFMAMSSDYDLYDGLTFDSIVTNGVSEIALPFAQGLHTSGNETDTSKEVTKIPTGGIEINGVTYIYYMSIRYWGVAGSWNVNYNGVVKTTDFVNFTEVESLKLTEDVAPNFGQVNPVKDPNSDYIYIFGIPGGRSGGAVVGRVLEKDYLNLEEYEYQTAENIWTKGNAGLKKLKNNPYYAIGPSVSELCIVYNAYLNKWMATFLKNGAIVMLTSDTIYGPYSNSTKLLTDVEVPGLYGGFTCDRYMFENGKSFYITVSKWGIYNTMLYHVVLK